MSLSMDAIANNTAKTVMNINILRQIEKDLDIDEKISILFLIVEDYANAFRDIFNLFQKAKTENSYIIVDYVKKYPENWEDKILEALCILNNREVTRKLRISFNDLDLQYVPKIRLYSKNINVVAKCLYRLCESLNENEQKLLLNYVKSDNSNYESLLDDIDYLELHMLYWMQIKYITISKGGVISSDEKEVSLEAIERAVCCMELKDVIKIVIIQACQGKIRGSINNCLTTDGLSDASVSEDVRQFTKFLIFMSTIQGFVSIRHKEQGSWFIQEVCKILRTYGNQLSFLECITKIITSMQEKNGTIEGTQVVQLPEIRNGRLDSDFQLRSVITSAF